MADKCVADIVASADENSPGGLFMRATLKVRSMEEKQAAVPRVLNAMFERYEDPNASNMELSQLNRAIANWTGYAVNYQVRDSGDPAKDELVEVFRDGRLVTDFKFEDIRKRAKC